MASLSSFSCPPPGSGSSPSCPKNENRGWRYFLITLSLLTLIQWAIRFFVFPLYESPKYFMGKRDDSRAVGVLRRVEAYNNRSDKTGEGKRLGGGGGEMRNVETHGGREEQERFEFKVEDLQSIDWRDPGSQEKGGEVMGANGLGESRFRKVIHSNSRYSTQTTSNPFATRKLAYSTSLLILLWEHLLSSNLTFRLSIKPLP